MKNSKPALLVYVVSGLIFLISSLIGYENVVFVTKPIIGSCIIFHYLNEVKGKINFWHVLFLFLYFWSGILNLFEDNLALQYVIFVNIAAYSILLSFVLQKVFHVNFRKIDNISLIYILLTIVFLFTLVYVCLGLVFNEENELYPFMIIYALILTFLTISSTILYTLKHSNAIVYLLLATFCYSICDLFYIIYYYYYDFFFFRFLSILCNILSYYFVVNYFLRETSTIFVNKTSNENF